MRQYASWKQIIIISSSSVKNNVKTETSIRAGPQGLNPIKLDATNLIVGKKFDHNQMMRSREYDDGMLFTLREAIGPLMGNAVHLDTIGRGIAVHHLLG